MKPSENSVSSCLQTDGLISAGIQREAAISGCALLMIYKANGKFSCLIPCDALDSKRKLSVLL
jgi:hypothetical protein